MPAPRHASSCSNGKSIAIALRSCNGLDEIDIRRNGFEDGLAFCLSITRTNDMVNMNILVDWSEVRATIRYELDRRAEKHREDEERAANRNRHIGWDEDGNEIQRPYEYISLDQGHIDRAQRELDNMTE